MTEEFIQLLKAVLPKKVKSLISAQIDYLNALEGRPRYLHERLTFSQAGEDGILNFLFLDKHLDFATISYLDIGARHPTNGSNTFLLYTRGASGVCVEADKTAIPLIRELRPRDTVLNLGISGTDSGTEKFYLMESGGSTFDKEEAEKRTRMGATRILEVLEVPTMSINQLISQHFRKYPDFLSIDIEGLDLTVLKSLDFSRYPIPVICAETCTFSENHIRPKDRAIGEFMISKGYEVYADTYVNTIFVEKEWFYRL